MTTFSMLFLIRHFIYNVILTAETGHAAHVLKTELYVVSPLLVWLHVDPLGNLADNGPMKASFHRPGLSKSGTMTSHFAANRKHDYPMTRHWDIRELLLLFAFADKLFHQCWCRRRYVSPDVLPYSYTFPYISLCISLYHNVSRYFPVHSFWAPCKAPILC